ncbi:MAG: VVA0879 family protein [Lysobacter sp.]
MERMTLSEFHAAVKAQGVPPEDVAVVCPMCATVESARDLIAAGAGDDFDSVQKFLGFSCVGRFTGAGSPRNEPDGEPCNWTLGGLFLAHKFEVVTDDGKGHAHFELCTPEQAQAHAARIKVEGGAA